MPHDDRAKNFIAIKGIMILLQDSQPLARRDFNDTASRLDLARKELQKGGLTRPVRAVDAVAISRCEFQIDILVKNAFSELKAYVICCDHKRLLWSMILRSLRSISSAKYSKLHFTYSRSIARYIERMLCPYELPGTAQRPLRSSQRLSVRVP